MPDGAATRPQVGESTTTLPKQIARTKVGSARGRRTLIATALLDTTGCTSTHLRLQPGKATSAAGQTDMNTGPDRAKSDIRVYHGPSEVGLSAKGA